MSIEYIKLFEHMLRKLVLLKPVIRHKYIFIAVKISKKFINPMRIRRKKKQYYFLTTPMQLFEN